MLKSEMQHQFWITKKTVQRKLGTKEDEHIISSDAELDAKIEVFKSINETSTELNKIIDQYQERLSILSQEESHFGRFLKEVGKRSKTTGPSITNTGKAASYCGQQRMCVRLPLLRLQHEVEVFRCRAVRDTLLTIQNMEKERTEYRAALCWMKSSSSELDPDTGKGLEKFRIAQSHVRMAKENFDTLSLNTVQKIDLLAASRCNMYSHALVSYMNELKQFALKTVGTFETISKSLDVKPKYDFTVLKDLTHDPEGGISQISCKMDKDQSLFFANEFSDIEPNKDDKSNEKDNVNAVEPENCTKKSDEFNSQAPLSEDLWLNISNDIKSVENSYAQPNIGNSLELIDNVNNANLPSSKKQMAKASKSNPWMELFADLDPLLNPEAFSLKLHGKNINFQQI